MATEKYNKSDPIDIGAGFEIKSMVELIAKITGFKRKIIWDTLKPDGQPRRCLDISKAEKEFGFRAKTKFEEGLRNTINWFMETKKPVRKLMINFTKQLIKKAFNSMGLDIIRISRSPAHSLLGLKDLSIRTIIDVGANEGQFAKYIKQLFPEARLYCIEPLLEPFHDLKLWSAKQKDGNVTAYNLALGETKATLKIFSHIEHSTSSSFLKTTKVCERVYPFTKKQVTVPVKLTTLDKWIKDLSTPLAPEILIKLDVQGYEDRVIRGGQKVFSMAKTCILEVCLDKLYKNQASFKDILFLLKNLGYHYAGNLNQNYAENGHVIYIDALFIK